MQPTRTAWIGHRSRGDPLRLRRATRAVPIRFCSRWGLPCRLRCRQRGALLPHHFTLTAPSIPAPQAKRKGGGGGLFSVALSLGLPPPDVIRHRMSMEPGLSSPAAFRPVQGRPSGRLTVQGMGGAGRGVKPTAVRSGKGYATTSAALRYSYYFRRGDLNLPGRRS